MITIDPVTYAILVRETETSIPIQTTDANLIVKRRATAIPLADGSAQITLSTVEAPKVVIKAPLPGAKGEKGERGLDGDGAADPGDLRLYFENALI